MDEPGLSRGKDHDSVIVQAVSHKRITSLITLSTSPSLCFSTCLERLEKQSNVAKTQSPSLSGIMTLQKKRQTRHSPVRSGTET